jgi:hypothetical protein
MKKIFFILFSFSTLLLVVSSCQKMDRPGLEGSKPDPAGAGVDLKLYMAMDGSNVDSIRAMRGTNKNGITFVPGKTGSALKGADNGYIEYPSPSLAKDVKSFSVSMWLNTQKHTDGAECVFMMPRSNDFWGNMFMLIEGNGSATDNTMQVKFHFAGQWMDYNGTSRIPDMYGAWKHLVFTYNTSTSKFEIYKNGVKLGMPASMTDRKSGANPLGSNFNFVNIDKFLVGGYQQNIGYGGSVQSWMKSYRGLLDQFRVYGKALSDAEVSALYSSGL